jgi:hypothetical protein
MIGADTLPALRKDSLAGSLFAIRAITGNVKELGVDATVRGSGLVVRGNSARQLTEPWLRRMHGDRKTPLTFRLDADTVQASGLGV